METYNLSDIEAALKGMSLREKIEYLEEVQNDISTEIDNLESVKSEVAGLLDDVVNQVCENYRGEISSALNDILAVHPGGVCNLLPDNKLDINGLVFRFYRYPEKDNQLSADVKGRKPIINTGDFNAEFGAIIKQLIPDATYDNMEITFLIPDEKDVPALLKNAVEKLIHIAPRIADLAVKYKFV